MCLWVLLACLPVHRVCSVSKKSGRSIWSPGTGVTDGSEPSCGCWEWNPGHLVLLTPEPSFLLSISFLDLFEERVHVPQHACGGQRTSLLSQFSPPNFTWVPGIMFTSPGLRGNSRHLLNNLIGPTVQVLTRTLDYVYNVKKTVKRQWGSRVKCLHSMCKALVQSSYWGSRDGAVVKSMYCACRRLQFSSQTHTGQLLAAGNSSPTDPQDPIPSSGFHRYHPHITNPHAQKRCVLVDTVSKEVW